MPRSGLSWRVFLALLLATIPPLLALVTAVLLQQSLLARVEPALVAAAVLLFAVAWAGILAVILAGGLGQELRSFVDLADRGAARSEGDDDDDRDAAYRRVATALEERNRQVADLATQSARAPISDKPRQVAGHVLAAARSITRDPTWRLAVLTDALPDLLPPGVYDAEGAEPQLLSDLERWASVADRTPGAVDRVEGQWGAFVVVPVDAGERLRAILYAPWEGRSEPSRAELDLLSLVGQHAATAVEHSLLYAQVRSQADALDRLAAVQTDFLRGVTHDLQTPLTSIRALAAEVRDQPGLTDSARADLELIEQQADRLRRMVGQLLVVSRLEAGALTPHQEVFSLAPLIRRTWDALRAERPFDLRVSGTPHLVVADPDRTEQVLWALLDNAVKYSPAGSPVTVAVEPDGTGHLSVSVTDEGAGMDADTQERAFDQFYRAAGARQLAPDGSGVGLYAARGLVEAMGGSIGLESRLGSGTTMRITLPAEPAESADDATSSH